MKHLSRWSAVDTHNFLEDTPETHGPPTSEFSPLRTLALSASKTLELVQAEIENFYWDDIGRTVVCAGIWWRLVPSVNYFSNINTSSELQHRRLRVFPLSSAVALSTLTFEN